MSAPDMDVIKDVPGYKVILKAVLKTQIQQLVEQLAAHTDEESVILTASVADGTLSHLGSDSGKSFLDDHDDVKSQFLGFCLKRHHKKKLAEKEKEQQAALQLAMSTSPRLSLGPSPRHGGIRGGFRIRPPGIRHEPYSISRHHRTDSFPNSDSNSAMNKNINTSVISTPIVKSELPSHSNESYETNTDNVQNVSSQSQIANEDSSSSSAFPIDSTQGQNNQSGDQDGQMSGSDSGLDPNVSVKIEAMNEDELEITGVEPGQNPVPQDSLLQNVGLDLNYLGMGAEGNQTDMIGQPGLTDADRTQNKDAPIRKSYPASFKLQVVAFAEVYGKHQASDLFKVDRKRVREWCQNKVRLSEASQTSRRIPGPGHPVKLRDTEDMLLAWFNDCRAAGIDVTGKAVRKEAKRLHDERGGESFKASMGWFQRFKKRHNISFRASSYVTDEANCENSETCENNETPEENTGNETPEEDD